MRTTSRTTRRLPDSNPFGGHEAPNGRTRCRVYLAGSFDDPKADNLLTELRRIVDNTTTSEIVIDLAAVTDISLQHLTEIASLARQARRLGNRLVLANPSWDVCRRTQVRLTESDRAVVIPLRRADGPVRHIERTFGTSVMDSLFDVGLRLTVVRSLVDQCAPSLRADVGSHLADAVDALDGLISKVRDATAPATSSAEHPPRHVRAEVEGFEIAAPVVRFAGEIDAAAHDYVAAVLTVLRGPVVVADLSEVNFIDARGIAAVMRAKQSLADQGRRLKITGAGGAVRRVIDILGLEGPLTD